jgi:hypothetical protein
VPAVATVGSPLPTGTKRYTMTLQIAASGGRDHISAHNDHNPATPSPPMHPCLTTLQGVDAVSKVTSA